MMASIMESSPTAHISPRTDADWQAWRETFTHLYMDENHPLPKVMDIMKEKYHFVASKKQYKDRIKAWDLRKYLKEDEARQIVDGELPGTVLHGVDNPEEAKRRAARSLQRKEARKRARSLQQPSPSSPSTPFSFVSTPPENSSALVTRRTSQLTAPTPLLRGLEVSGITEQFLFKLRSWTHDAYMFGHWDTTKLGNQHQNGRQASRMFSSYLKAGTNLIENGKPELAFNQWNRAFASFSSPNLFQSWYHEIPMSLLFEVGRVAHSGHSPLAAMLLQSIKRWAQAHLDEKDSRHALFSLFGELQVPQLRDLYTRAARCLYSGLESRVDGRHQLLYDVRLNRALDLLWYDSEADLSEWLPPMEEVDQAFGPNNSYAVYFLLLEAYRLVAQEAWTEVEQVCAQVRDRLDALKDMPNSFDPWRVGLAYRRLGRQQHAKRRFADARRSFNTALRYVSDDSELSTSVLIEICQRQQSMAGEMQDQEDVFFWNSMLSRVEQKTKAQGEAEANILDGRSRVLSPEPGENEDEDDIDGDEFPVRKRRRLCLPPTDFDPLNRRSTL